MNVQDHPSTQDTAPPRGLPMARSEFIALMGMMFATIAFSIDAMLPAQGAMAAELAPTDPNRVQLVIVAFVFGMGIGTFFTGPLSDAFGRKPVILAGVAIYILAALAALFSNSLELILIARFFQGLGASAPRVVSMAIVRDLFKGREMAKILSISMMVFTLFPAIAPYIGAQIIKLGDWRGIFLAFVVFGIIISLWLSLRLPEPLERAARRKFRPAQIWSAIREVFAHPTVRLSIAVQTLTFATLFSTIVSVQPIYEQLFQRADSFPLWFGAIALLSAGASVLNATFVVRLGMRRIVTWTFCGQILLSGMMVIASMSGLALGTLFAVFLVYQLGIFFQAGAVIGNLNAIALEPLAHIAGTASSVTSAVPTILAMLIAVPLGMAFDGTALPLSVGTLVMSVVALALMLTMRRENDQEGDA